MSTFLLLGHFNSINGSRLGTLRAGTQIVILFNPQPTTSDGLQALGTWPDGP